MNVSPISNYTTNTHNIKTTKQKAEPKHVPFGFGEDYGGDPFPMPNCEGDGDDLSFWGKLKGAAIVFFAPISLPIISYRIHLKDKKEDEMYRRMLDFKVKDDDEEVNFLEDDDDKKVS